MSAIINDPPVDVVVIGAGTTGGTASVVLAGAGYKVHCIEKGPYWNYSTDFQQFNKFDEWAIIMQHKFDQPLSQYSMTLRNNTNQFANPTRRYTPTQQIPFPTGVGGGCQHYSGTSGRIGPFWYEAFSTTMSQYGAGALPPNSDLIDFPYSYNDIESYYVEWEKEWGMSGTNQAPFTPMSVDYPVPPHPVTPLGTLFQNSAEALGYHPFPAVTSIVSQPYMNQYGLPRNGCIYCGWCGEVCDFPCEVGAKNNSSVTSIPGAIKYSNYQLTTGAYVTRVNLNTTTGLATGVTYLDAEGNTHFQAASVVFLGAWSLNNVRILLLSGIGQPYNSTTVTGSVGRGIMDASTAGGTASASGTLAMGGNSYPAGNGSGGSYCIQDFADNNFSHAGLDFIGGSTIAIGGYLGTGPNNLTSFTSPSASNWGSKYKATLKNSKLPTSRSVAIGMAGPNLPVTTHWADLDPHYTDQYGDPIIRTTNDFSANCWNAASYLVPLVEPILTKMGCTNVTTSKGGAVGSTNYQSWSIHQRGPARLGASESNSVLNQWHQTWAVQNVFLAGECANPALPPHQQGNAGTHSFGNGAYIASEGIQMYLKSPGSLATSTPP
jgi:gluconate 2-dehydrogenase alpha chain